MNANFVAYASLLGVAKFAGVASSAKTVACNIPSTTYKYHLKSVKQPHSQMIPGNAISGQKFPFPASLVIIGASSLEGLCTVPMLGPTAASQEPALRNR